MILILGDCQDENSGIVHMENENIPEVTSELNALDELVVMVQLDELPEEELRYLRYLGREGNCDVYYTTPYDNQMGNTDEMETGLTFYFTNRSTFEVMKTWEMRPLLSSKVKLIDDKIYVVKPDSITVISKQSKDIERMEMPKAIAQEEHLYGFDIFDDLSPFVYRNEEGLWYLKDIGAEPTLLRQPVKFEPNPLIEFGSYIQPTFINDGTEIIVDVAAYEASAGYVICDLNSLTCDERSQGGQSALERLESDSNFLQFFTPNEGINPWQQHGVNLKTKTLIGQSLLDLESNSGETRQMDDYLQNGNVLVLAIGTRNEGGVLPKWIDIEGYYIEEDGRLSFLDYLERGEDVALSLIGMTPEGKVIDSHENYNPELMAGHLEIFMTH